MESINSRDLRARFYHRQLPEEIRQYLKGRGISDAVIDHELLGWTGERISIPIFDVQRKVVAFQFARDPRGPETAPKMMAEPQADAELYGIDLLATRPQRVVICEGEFDRLVLISRGIPAVTATGGAFGFKPHWAMHFEGIPHVYLCFDRDDAGRVGTARVKDYLPQAHIVTLPEAVGEHGDVTDYFVRLGFTSVDFDMLLANAEIADEGSKSNTAIREEASRRTASTLYPPLSRRAARVKADVPLARVVGQYLILKASGGRLVGRCPFHDDGTPSFFLYPNDTYHCFGCGAAGDVISFVMRIKHETFTQALSSLEHFTSWNDHAA